MGDKFKPNSIYLKTGDFRALLDCRCQGPERWQVCEDCINGWPWPGGGQAVVQPICERQLCWHNLVPQRRRFPHTDRFDFCWAQSESISILVSPSFPWLRNWRGAVVALQQRQG